MATVKVYHRESDGSPWYAVLWNGRVEEVFVQGEEQDAAAYAAGLVAFGGPMFQEAA
jgi:hypothetical protein